MDFSTRPRPQRTSARPPPRGPFLFFALEAGRPWQGSMRVALTGLTQLELGRGDRRRLLPGRLELDDPWMSTRHARLIATADGWHVEDLDSRNGTLVGDRPIGSHRLVDGDLLEVGGSFFIYRAALPLAADQTAPATAHPLGLATVLPDFDADLDRLARLAGSDVPIMLHGPSGAGKEVTARAVHARSGRPGAFVAVNCAALPANLVEAELFGHARGAFTGATTDRVGLIGSADQGTLLLDEIGDMPLEIQPALLRVLQDRALTPVGSTRAVAVDFRLIVATHRDLAGQVFAGHFREDLFARLAGFTLTLPPLERRREDLSTLLCHLAARLPAGGARAFDLDAARAVMRYRWPRNVRELERAITLAVTLAGPDEIQPRHLPPEVTAAAPSAPPAAEPAGLDVAPSFADLDDADTTEDADPRHQVDDDDPRRAELIEALDRYGGNISAVARALGKPRSQIQRWMRRWGLRGAG